jgi:hypothetical protein
MERSRGSPDSPCLDMRARHVKKHPGSRTRSDHLARLMLQATLTIDRQGKLAANR